MSLLRFGKISKYSYQSSNVDTYSLQWTFTLDVFFPLHFPSKEQQYPTHVILVQENSRGTSLMVLVVKTSPSNAGGSGSIPDWRSKIPCALRPKKNKIQNRGNIVNKFNKDYKYGPHQKKKKKKENSRESDSFTHTPARLSLPFSVFLFSLFTALLPSV